MNSAIIKLNLNNAKKIHDSILPEIIDNNSKRASVKIKVNKDEITLNFTAKDINALKVFINHILRLIMLSEKTMNIKGEI